MARLRPKTPPHEALLALLDEEGRLVLHVTPGARCEALEIDDGRLKAKVCAQPEDGKANEAVRNLLGMGFDIGPTRITLLRGATSRMKQFRLDLS